MIPFLDINTPHRELEDHFISVFQEAMKSGRFIGGPMVEEFEREFAAFCNTKYCVGVGSGTDALRFALIAAGVKKGDVVITVPNTFIATTEAISQAGAIPAFVDIDPKTYNMDPNKLEDYLKTRLKPDALHLKPKPTALVPVHLYGQMADMDSISELAKRYNLLVIEDACQAHGAEYYSNTEKCWEKAGSIGDAGAFSFYPGKNLGAFGEGGAVTTNDKGIAEKIRMIRDHGQAKKYYHEMEGYNGRLDAIQAGILRIKLENLSEWNENRQQKAAKYNELLSDIDEVTVSYEPEWTKSVYHLYVIRTGNRDELQKHLSDNQIATGLHYPIPLHLQNAYKSLGYKEGDYPVTEIVSQEILSLPMFPHLEEDQQIYVADKIKEWVKKA